MVAEKCESKDSRNECVDAALVAGIGYAVLASTTIHLTSNGRNHATMWPADAVILALLLKQPKRHWPWILLAGWGGNLIANTLTRGWMPGLVLYGAINMAQTWLAAWLILKVNRTGDVLANAGTVSRFILCAGVIAPVLGATLGSLITLSNYGEAFGPSFVRWYLSNALGFLVLAPFLKAAFDGSHWNSFKSRTVTERFEALGLLALHALLTGIVFGQSDIPLLFLPISSLLLISFRLGRSGAMVGVMIVALFGATATFSGDGPITLMRYPADMREFHFQFYLAVLLATALPVAAIVSSRQEALRHLAEREEALRLMMAHSPDGILSFDLAGICRWADGPLERYLGLAPADMLGRSMDVVSPLAHDAASLMRTKAGKTHPGCFEFTPMLRPDIVLEGSIGLLKRDGSNAGTVIALRDITARKASENKLASKAFTDDLTGLSNRLGFRKMLRAFVENLSHPASLAIIDVDGFKAINDSHGHAVGDAVLAEIARRMKQSMREEDFIARIGGDEFAILLCCDPETARKACERMVEVIRQAPVYSKGAVRILASVSCGLAEYRPGLSQDQVFDAADAALYQLKNVGRNGVRTAA